LPRLNIDTKQISVSGISSGADYTVQFHVAFSDVLMGAGVYAGEPYHCAVTRFKDDPPEIPYDHCKYHPTWVNISQLADYAREQEKLGTIAPLNNLKEDRIYLYRGTKDAIYLEGSVANTGDFYKTFLQDPGQVLLVNNIPSQHAIPTVDFGTPCGVNGFPPAIERCNYDGAGECLKHIYQRTPLKLPGTPSDENLFEFDQTPFFGNVFPGLYDKGWVYVPKSCQTQNNANPCKLHIFFHGCTLAYNSNGFNFTYIKHAGFNPWAETNEMVVLYPQMGGYKNGTQQQMMGCWDSFSDTGENYSLNTGVQMSTVRRMLKAIAGI